MSIKYISLSRDMSYPVRITEVHVQAGQSVLDGTPLYTLQMADGQRIVMLSNFAGRVTEGPVAPFTSFSQAMPVIGIDDGVVLSSARVEELVPNQHEATGSAASTSTSGFSENSKNYPSGNLEHDLLDVMARNLTYTVLYEQEGFRGLVARELIKKGYSEETAYNAAHDPKVDEVWNKRDIHTSVTVPLTPESVFFRTISILLISFFGGIIAGVGGIALETYFPYRFSYNLGFATSVVIVSVVVLYFLFLVILPRGSNQVVKITAFLVAHVIILLAFIMTGPNAKAGMPYIGEYLNYFTGYSPAEAYKKMQSARSLAMLEHALSRDASAKEPAIFHWQQVTYLIGVVFTVAYSLFWVFVPPSLYERITGVHGARPAITSRFAHAAIAGGVAFFLAALYFTAIDRGCGGATCKFFHDNGGEVLVLAIASGILIELIGKVIGVLRRR